MLLALISFALGVGVGGFLYHLYSNPVLKLQRKARRDISTHLNDRGMPHDRHNDYQLHLYALNCRRHGAAVEEVRAGLMILADYIPQGKRGQYVGDILRSVIVGYRLEAAK